MAAGKFVDPKPFRGGLRDIFLSFGYDPSPAELAQFETVPGGPGGHQRALSAVGSYVTALKAEEERKANDPLGKFVKEQTPKIGEYEQQASQVYEELKGIISKAPKLFGELSPDQIDKYLAPIKQASAQTLSQVEGAFGRRGLVGSSVEGQSLAEQDRLFRENALATGLQIGLTAQQQQAAAREQQIAQLYGQAANIRGIVGAGNQTLSANDLAQLQFFAGLPVALRGEAAQARAAAEAAAKKKKGLGGAIGSLVGLGAGAFFGGPIGAGIGSSLGGSLGNLAEGEGDLAAGGAGQIPWWMMLGQKPGVSSGPINTKGTSLTPDSAINSYGFVPEGIYNG